MNTKYNIKIAAILSLIIISPVMTLFIISTTIIMMFTENTALSYIITFFVWGTVEGLPFLALIGKSKWNILIKIGLMLVTVALSAFLIYLLYVLPTF